MLFMMTNYLHEAYGSEKEWGEGGLCKETLPICMKELKGLKKIMGKSKCLQWWARLCSNSALPIYQVWEHKLLVISGACLQIVKMNSANIKMQKYTTIFITGFYHDYKTSLTPSRKESKKESYFVKCSFNLSNWTHPAIFESKCKNKRSVWLTCITRTEKQELCYSQLLQMKFT